MVSPTARSCKVNAISSWQRVVHSPKKGIMLSVVITKVDELQSEVLDGRFLHHGAEMLSVLRLNYA